MATDYLVADLRRGLAVDPATAELGLVLSVTGGRLVLTGEVATETCRQDVRRVVAEVVPPGVEVIDQVEVLRLSGPREPEHLS